MKSILSTITVVTLIMFVSLLIIGEVAYPMYIGEPSYYHVARIDCLMVAVACLAVSVTSAFVVTFAATRF